MPALTDLPALDVAIGLIFIYATLALIVSGVNELIMRWLSMRARFLEKGLRNLLTDDAQAKAVLEHPLVRGLSFRGNTDKRKTPSYIPSRTFAVALLDTLVPPEEGADSKDLVKAVEAEIKDVQPPKLRKALESLLRGVGGDRDKFRASIEHWYDDAMDRVSGWYKRRVQTFLIVIGVLAAVGLNADSMAIANSLWKDDTVRAAVVNEATKAKPPKGTPQQQVNQAGARVDEVKKLRVPIGWHDVKGDPRKPPSDLEGWIAKFVGILLTGLAISLGAPFWFDLLGTATRLRSSGAKPKPSEAEA